MRPPILLLGLLLAANPAQAADAETESMEATIWNTSDDDIIVVVQTPSHPDRLLRTVQVPSQTVVSGIPLPQVEEDLLAVAFRARETPIGLEIDRPARIVGVRKLFPSKKGPLINSTIPILLYRSYEPRSRRGGGYGSEFHFVDEESHYHSRALSAPLLTVRAQALLAEALQSDKQIAYKNQEQRQ